MDRVIAPLTFSRVEQSGEIHVEPRSRLVDAVHEQSAVLRDPDLPGRLANPTPEVSDPR